MGILLLVIVIIFFASYLNGKKTLAKQKECTLHKWVYQGEEPNTYMICEVCKQLPGSIKLDI